MKATVDEANSISGVNQKILNIKEGIEMKMAICRQAAKNRVSNVITTKSMVKLFGGLAAGALLLVSTALPSAIINADGPSKAAVSQGAAIIPDDEWLFSFPYFDDFQSATAKDVSLVEISTAQPQIIADEEWLFDSPYFDDFRAETGKAVSLVEIDAAQPQIIQDDEWVFGFPYFDDFAAGTAVGPLSTEKFGHYPEDLNP